jgi:glycosyltransferase involved in cell wall biosynthesis
MTKQRPLVSCIIDTYYRPAMLRDAVLAFRAQTYDNIEIVIINNGATPETVSYLLGLEKEEQRVKLVNFETNVFSWVDIGLHVRVTYNAALRACKGELVTHQGDDDWVASDYIERMVRLFEENPECTTAIGRCVHSLPNGTFGLNPPAKRPRYLPGHELALDQATGSKKFCQLNPGYCFVMKKDELERNGGFHEQYELHQMFSIVSFGITGYDPDALVYWRRHELQLNRMGTVKCVYWGKSIEKLLNDPGIRLLERWKSKFGEESSKTVEMYLLKEWVKSLTVVTFCHFFHLRFVVAFGFLLLLRKSPSRKGLSLEIIRGSFRSSASHILVGRIFLAFPKLIKGLFTNPVSTLKKFKNFKKIIFQ